VKFLFSCGSDAVISSIYLFLIFFIAFTIAFDFTQSVAHYLRSLAGVAR